MLKRRRQHLVLVAALASIVSCAYANRFTVDRQTPLPTPLKEAEKEGSQAGVAIHLDAQQRLVLATSLGFCAEPSPDAMSAYAASLGLRWKKKDQEAILDFLSKSESNDIGLRTQSITLMRDALYRVCEASHNGKLADWEVGLLLRQSQDLTAVVLAIEELTGILKPGSDTRPSPDQPGRDDGDGEDESAEEGAEEDGAEEDDAEEDGAEEDDAEEDGAEEDDAEEDDAEEDDAEEDDAEEDDAEEDDAEEDDAEEDDAEEDDAEEDDAEEDGTQERRPSGRTERTRDTGRAGLPSQSATMLFPDPRSTKIVADAVKEMVFKVLESNHEREMCVAIWSAMANSEANGRNRHVADSLLRECGELLNPRNVPMSEKDVFLAARGSAEGLLGALPLDDPLDSE